MVVRPLPFLALALTRLADALGGDVFWAAGLSLFGDIPRKPHWPVKTHLWVNAGRLDALDVGTPCVLFHCSPLTSRSAQTARRPDPRHALRPERHCRRGSRVQLRPRARRNQLRRAPRRGAERSRRKGLAGRPWIGPLVNGRRTCGAPYLIPVELLNSLHCCCAPATWACLLTQRANAPHARACLRCDLRGSIFTSYNSPSRRVAYTDPIVTVSSSWTAILMHILGLPLAIVDLALHCVFEMLTVGSSSRFARAVGLWGTGTACRLTMRRPCRSPSHSSAGSKSVEVARHSCERVLLGEGRRCVAGSV